MNSTMIKLITIIVVLVLPTVLNCHEPLLHEYFEMRGTLLLPKKYNNEDKIHINVADDGTIYLLYDELIKVEDNYYFELLNVNKNTVTYVPLPYSLVGDQNNTSVSIGDFDISNDIVSVLIHGRCLVIYKYDSSAFIPVYIHHDGNYANVKINNRQIFAYTSDIYYGTKVMKIKFDNFIMKTEVLEHKFINPIGIEFTFFQPKQLIDVNEHQIAIANLDNYHIDFYNWKFEKTSSFKLQPHEWVKGEKIIAHFSDSDLRIDTKNSKNEIEHLRPLLNDFSMIHRIHYCSPEMLLVLWSLPSETTLYDFRFDLLKKQTSGWKVFKNNLKNYEVDSDEKMKDIMNKWKVKNSYVSENEYLLLVEPVPFELNEEISNLTLATIKTKINDYYMDNDLRYTIVILKMKCEN